MFRLPTPTDFCSRPICHQAALFWLFAVVGGSAGLPRVVIAAEQQWELSPYRIKLHVVVDTIDQPQQALREEIVGYLDRRISATLRPLWSVEFSLPTDSFRHQLLTQLAELSQDSDLEGPAGFDKEMYLVISSTVGGYVIRCREVDRYTNFWGPVLQTNVRQQWSLLEGCFNVVRSTFAPLAKVRRILEDEQHVLLHFKGSDLPRQSDGSWFAEQGSVFQAVMIRLTRQGEVRPDGIAQVPWTYLTLKDIQDDLGLCLVRSGIQHPFGVRRRGRVEHIAIAMRHPSGATRVRFHARHDESQPLVGYEVFQRESEEDKAVLLGLTDVRGIVDVPPAKEKVTTLFLRSDGKLLAKAPIVPGAKEIVEVPIADDTARLNAQAELISLREQLIDLVARRNILISRVRDRLQNSELENAQELLSQLDALPGRAQFAQLLDSAERDQRNRSEDERVQARIEKLFADTRKLLGQFLDLRQITDLRTEVSQARNETSS